VKDESDDDSSSSSPEQPQRKMEMNTKVTRESMPVTQSKELIPRVIEITHDSETLRS
jgi:hypothetical protein